MPTLKESMDTITTKVIADVLNLPIRRQMQVIRAIAGSDASFSDGVDHFISGADQVESDLDDEEADERCKAGLTRAQAWAKVAADAERIPELAPITTRARQLNPEMGGDIK